MQSTYHVLEIKGSDQYSMLFIEINILYLHTFFYLTDIYRDGGSGAPQILADHTVEDGRK
jgi:hypothetical protein